MPDWSVPYVEVNDDGSVDVLIDTPAGSVDVTAADSPEDVEAVEDSLGEVYLDVSDGDVVRVSIPVDEFRSLVESSRSDAEDGEEVPEDAVPDDMAPVPLDMSPSSFSPQTWQLNMAEHRPIGYHYVMSRVGSYNNHYVLVLGRDITYADGVYSYVDCDMYSVYSTGSSSSARYVYDVDDHATGTISSAAYVVYSDLYFDFIGGRSFSYSYLLVVFLLLMVVVLIWWRGKRKT